MMKAKQITLIVLGILCIYSVNAQLTRLDLLPLIRITDGTIASYDPPITRPPASPGDTGPFIDGVDKVGRIENICPNGEIALSATSLLTIGISFQWYKCVATRSLLYFKGSPEYTWGNWTLIRGATSRTYNVKYSQDFSSLSTLHVAYICVMSSRAGSSATGIIGISKAAPPVISDLTVETAYVCAGQGDEIQIDPDFEVTGDQVDVYWQRENSTNPGVWEDLSDDISPFYFPYATYSDGTYDYRLAVSHTCGDYYSTSLHDLPIYVEVGNVEEYEPILTEQRTITTCVNQQATLALSLINNNDDFWDYTHLWQYSLDGGATWTSITTTAGGIFADYTTLSLKVTPNSTSYNNALFRCTTTGACATITSDPFTVEINTAPILENIEVNSEIVCAGETVTFNAVVTEDELARPYEYRWRVSGNLAEQSFSEIDSVFTYDMGTSSVVITCEVQNANECVGIISDYSKTMNVYDIPGVSINVTKTGCSQSTADLTAEVENGKEPYSYVWNTLATTRTITDQPANAYYSVSVTDACTSTDTIGTYVSSLPPLALNYTSENVLCNGQANGSIHAIITGGVAPYDIEIFKNTDTGAVMFSSIIDTISGLINFEDLYAGEYKVIAIDFCDVKDSIEISVTQPNTLTATIIDYQDVTCYSGGDGFATVDINGGTEPYTINWINGQRTETAIGLFAGDHTVNIIDNNGCFASAEVSLSQPNEFTLTYDIVDLSCNAADDGEIAIYPTGGTQPYDITLYGPYSLVISGTNFSGLAAGNYTYVASDACGFLYRESVIVSEPDELQYSTNIAHVSCNGEANGEAEIITSDGVDPVNFMWYDSSTVNYHADLDTGYYSYIVSDACSSFTDSIYIEEPDELIAIIEAEHINCAGDPTGIASAIVEGGTYPMSFSWSNGMRYQMINNLFAGDYTVQVVDANGCTAYNSVTINQNPLLQVSMQTTDVICAGDSTGQIFIDTLYGFGSLSYTWSNDLWNGQDTIRNVAAGNYSVTVVDGCETAVIVPITINELHAPLTVDVQYSDITCNGLVDGSIMLNALSGVAPYSYQWRDIDTTTNSLSELSSGLYYFSVSDQCTTISDSVSVVQPDALSVEIVSTDISCFGYIDGTASATVTGGTEPYIYNWTNGQTSREAQNLYSGSHYLNVIDANGCTSLNSIEINQPLALQVEVETTDVLCNGDETGRIVITPMGGSGAYSYTWDNGFIGDTITDVAAGTYSLIVADECRATIQKEVTITEPEPFAVTSDLRNVSCFGLADGSVTLYPTQGVAPYIVSWDNGASDFVLESLLADTLTYIVSDACNDSLRGVIVIEQPDIMDLNVDTDSALCNGFGDGSASAIISGGIAPYIYNWSNGVQSQSVSGLFAGSYSVNVFDANGCLASEDFEISEPTAIEVNMVVTNAECERANGKIETSVFGGNAPYSFFWSDSSVRMELDSVLPGVYALTVTDANGCIVIQRKEIGVDAAPYDICILTVDREIGKNKIVWEKKNNSSVTGVNVYRMVGGEYQWLGSVDSSELSYYDDELSTPKVVASRYVISTNDACGNESELSPFHQTIHLGSAMGVDNNTVVLDWTEYIDESGEFEPIWYYLYRGTNEREMELFDSVDAQVGTEYNDENPQGSIYYRVGVKKADACVSTGRLKSESGPYSQSLSNISESTIDITRLESIDELLVIYPNPSDGKFTIIFDEFEGAKAVITNISGQAVWQQKLLNAETSVNLDVLPIGIYNLMISTNTKEFNKQIVIEK